ncbi:MAG: tetratricopeptide repeat protein, partial [Myxococcota bacterium]
MRQYCDLALVVGLVLTVGIGVGCRAPGTATPSQDPAAESAATASLLELGDQALARGELENAAKRYQRALATQPGAVRPRVGLAWVAVQRGQWEAARQRAEEALALEPDNADALVVLAQVERLDGHEDPARELLWRALRIDPRDPRAHTLLAALTGPAPRRVTLGAQDAVALASAHPYDPWATLQAARALVD